MIYHPHPHHPGLADKGHHQEEGLHAFAANTRGWQVDIALCTALLSAASDSVLHCIVSRKVHCTCRELHTIALPLIGKNAPQ